MRLALLRCFLRFGLCLSLSENSGLYMLHAPQFDLSVIASRGKEQGVRGGPGHRVYYLEVARDPRN